MMKIEAQADWKLCELVDKNYLYLNVFTSMGYLRWWDKLVHAKEPEKEELADSLRLYDRPDPMPWLSVR